MRGREGESAREEEGNEEGVNWGGKEEVSWERMREKLEGDREERKERRVRAT